MYSEIGGNCPKKISDGMSQSTCKIHVITCEIYDIKFICYNM